MFWRQPSSRLDRLKRTIYMKTHPNASKLDMMGIQVYHILIGTALLFVILVLLRLAYIRFRKRPRFCGEVRQCGWGDVVRQIQAEIRRGMPVDDDDFSDSA